jgi:hypothetical protein
MAPSAERPAAAAVAAAAEARRRQRMRTLGAAATNVLLYLLFVSATVCLLLAAILTVLRVIVWSGLEFPVGARQVGLLLGVAAATTLLGFGLYGWRRQR